MLDLTAARAEVEKYVEATLDPVLDPTAGGDIDTALLRTQRATIWSPATGYGAGQRVVPPVPGGRTYICVLAGTSDPANEPAWLIAPPYFGPVNPIGPWWGLGPVPFVGPVATTPWLWGLADGTVAWRAAEPFLGEIYDVPAAAAECWRMKARKAASRVDGSIAGTLSAQSSQIYRQCMSMAASLQPVRFG